MEKINKKMILLIIALFLQFCGQTQALGSYNENMNDYNLFVESEQSKWGRINYRKILQFNSFTKSISNGWSSLHDYSVSIRTDRVVMQYITNTSQFIPLDYEPKQVIVQAPPPIYNTAVQTGVDAFKMQIYHENNIDYTNVVVKVLKAKIELIGGHPTVFSYSYVTQGQADNWQESYIYTEPSMYYSFSIDLWISNKDGTAITNQAKYKVYIYASNQSDFSDSCIVYENGLSLDFNNYDTSIAVSRMSIQINTPNIYYTDYYGQYRSTAATWALISNALLYARLIYSPYFTQAEPVLFAPFKDTNLFEEDLKGATYTPDNSIPPTETFWVYYSYKLSEDIKQNISLSNDYEIWNETLNATETNSFSYSFEFQYLKVEQEEKQYYYNLESIKPESLGNWRFNVFGTNWELDFNIIRDTLAYLVNITIFIFQAILYLLIIAFNFLIIQTLLWLIVLIWNYPIYWVVYATVSIVFYTMFFFTWIWNKLVILWKEIIEPIVAWIWNETVAILRFIYNWLFKEGGLQTLVNLYLTLVSYILAIIFFVLTAGLINFTETQQAMAEFLIQLNSVFFQIGSIFISNFPLLIGYSGTYILLVGLVYLKYIYAKARGYTTRATKLQSMINVYKLPIVLIIRISQYIIGFIQGGVPTDGADE